MKVIRVAEVLNGLDEIIKKKEEEKEQFLSLRDELNRFIDLNDALKGEGGNAIREHFLTLHFPAIILFNLFLEEYIDVLKNVKQLVSSFEANNGLVRQDFIESHVKEGLQKLENLTHEITANINNNYGEVSDLVPYGYVKTTEFDFYMTCSRTVIQDTLTDFAELDEDSTSKLEKPADSLGEISQFVTKIQGWTRNGVFLTPSEIGEIENYFSESDVIEQMIDNATKLSIEQGDSTIQGDIANWLSDLGKFNGAYDVAKGALVYKILQTGMLELVKDGKGNFIVKASRAWVQQNGKYESKLAESIYKILKNSDKTSVNPLSRYLAKSGNAPSGVLREIIGLNGKTNRISFGKIADSYSNTLVFDKNDLKNYRMRVDVDGTVRQFSNADNLAKFTKRIPYVGILFSLGTNSGEYYSDENKHKSFLEKSGRFSSGIGLDLGVAGVTTAGAGIGTLICPGAGTIIGGAIGAGIGIVGSWIVEDTVKDWGEAAGGWIEDRVDDGIELYNDAKDWISVKTDDLVSNVSDFVSGIFN